MKLKYEVMGSQRYQIQKAERLAMIKEVRTSQTFENPREYFIVVNKISGHKRIESRDRVNRLIAAKDGKENSN